jgi:acyl-ACP thioesterase
MFTKNFNVPYYGLDMKERLKTGLLLQFFQETAASHADSVGIGVSAMLKRDMTWVLRRYRVKIHSLPGLCDLTVRTWYEPQRNLVSVRLFEVSDGTGAVIAEAWSGWVVLDLKRGRPIRLDRALPTEYYENAESVHPGEIEGLEKPEEPFDDEREFRVRWNELDLNEHTNHTAYFDWAIESVPDDVLENYKPSGFDAEYLTSIPRTCVTVRTKRTKKNRDSPLKFFHSVLISGSGTEAARLATTWRTSEALPGAVKRL